MLQAFEFNSVIDKEGIIYIPQQYLSNISSPVKVILLSNGKPNNRNIHFSAINLETKGFKFNRDEANER